MKKYSILAGLTRGDYSISKYNSCTYSVVRYEDTIFVHWSSDYISDRFDITRYRNSGAYSEYSNGNFLSSIYPS